VSQPFDGVRLTGNISIDVSNADCRFDRPFWDELDRSEMKPAMQWDGPKLAPMRGQDPTIERWAAKVDGSSLLSEAAKEFLEKSYAGQLVYYCDASFSQPQTATFRLAVRVKAIHGHTAESQSRFMVEGFMLPVNFFFQRAKVHFNTMVREKKKLGLVWDLDQTLIQSGTSEKPLPPAVLQQAKYDPARVRQVGSKTVVLRTGVRTALDKLSRTFEMHLFCNGYMSVRAALRHPQGNAFC
jgi:hypothetical protein